MLSAHWDARPYADHDPDEGLHNTPIDGANDGASGVGVLIEMARNFSRQLPDIGVDIIFFDLEDYGPPQDAQSAQGEDHWGLGSQFWSNNPHKANYRARYGILLDMVGDRELRIYYEGNSMKYARDVAKSIWQTARRLGVRAFVPRMRHTIQDDHLALNEIAGIPSVDLIDFDYPRPGIGAPQYWHTEQDVPANCSGESMAAVVWVVHQWLKQQ